MILGPFIDFVLSVNVKAVAVVAAVAAAVAVVVVDVVVVVRLLFPDSKPSETRIDLFRNEKRIRLCHFQFQN